MLIPLMVSVIAPSYIGARPPGACVGVDINQTVIEQAIFTVGCSGIILTDVLTTSPPGKCYIPNKIKNGIHYR